MISKEDIEHLKDLARVEFGEKETEKLANDLGSILEHISSMEEADISNAPDMTFALEGAKNIYRKDFLADSPRSAAAESEERTELAASLIEAFPEKYEAGHGTYLKVRPIL